MGSEQIKEKLIQPGEYTPQILELIDVLKQRMTDNLIGFTDDQINVYDVDGTIYILANPQLGEEVVIDENNRAKIVPMHNITLVYDKDWIRTRFDNGKCMLEWKQPRLRIFRPDLCVRIDERGVMLPSHPLTETNHEQRGSVKGRSATLFALSALSSP